MTNYVHVAAMHGGSSPDGSMPALLYALVCVIFGFQFIFGFMNRMDMRKKYGLEVQLAAAAHILLNMQ